MGQKCTQYGRETNTSQVFGNCGSLIPPPTIRIRHLLHVVEEHLEARVDHLFQVLVEHFFKVHLYDIQYVLIYCKEYINSL